MKLVHTADIHIGMENYGRLDPETGLSSRLQDFLKAYDAMVDYAIENKVDYFVFSGDAFKTREPTPTHLREFAKRIKRLAKAGIEVVLLVGNHDTGNATGKANTLDIYSALETEHVHVIREPGLTRVNNLQIVGIPWVSRAEFAGIQSKIKELLAKVDPAKPAIIMAHASISGAKYGSERSVMMGGDFVLDKEVLDHPKISYVALGHIHQRQVLAGTKIPMVYAGSLERVDFGEAKEDKGFEVVTLKEEPGKWRATHEHVSTNPRKFVEISIDLTKDGNNPTAEVIGAIGKYDVKDAVVKVIINVPPEGAHDVDIQQIRHALKESFFIAAISKNISRITRETLGETPEELSPLQALERYFTAKKVEAKRSKHLSDLARELLEL
jgi:DNA repair protein SbcD/Mre11